MIDNIFDNYPLAKQAIFNHLWNAYQVTKNMYYNMDYHNKLMVIQGCLGFPVETVDIDIVKNNLYIYESILMDHFSDILDPLEIFKTMDYNLREDYINWKSKINPSISDCLIALPVPKVTYKKSIRNYLRKLINPITEERIPVDNFWQECIIQFKNYETAPF